MSTSITFGTGQLPREHQEANIHIDRTTAISRWRGERMDYGLAIDVLLADDRRGTPRSRGNVTVD